MRRLRERLTFANVTASLALFIALGGTSYAAITLPRNSVGTNQLRTGSIRSVDVKDRSLEARDLSVAARRFLKGQKGEQGERGPQGPAGSAGEAGSSGGGNTGTTAAGITTTTVPASGRSPAAPDPESASQADATATCPSGRATGGGVRVESIAHQLVIASFPVGGNAWQAVVGNYNTTAYDFTVYVICAS